jgi:hypothetical protein
LNIFWRSWWSWIVSSMFWSVVKNSSLGWISMELRGEFYQDTITLFLFYGIKWVIMIMFVGGRIQLTNCWSFVQFLVSPIMAVCCGGAFSLNSLISLQIVLQPPKNPLVSIQMCLSCLCSWYWIGMVSIGWLELVESYSQSDLCPWS